MSPNGGSDKLPIKMLNDRLLVKLPREDGERRSSGGILIPATAQVAKRLVWAEVVASGPTCGPASSGDRVLFTPEDRYEVEVGARTTSSCASATSTPSPPSASRGSTGLYL